MSNKLTEWLVRLKFYLGLGLIYALVVAFGWYVFQPASNFEHIRPVSLTKAEQKPYQPSSRSISGQPVRLVIPASGIDLSIIPGYYDSSSGNWTLSGYDAQFDMMSALANNVSGQTFIYGHNNDFVLGSLRHNTPALGATALIYTSNGHILSYRFTSVSNVGPDDGSILSYSGSPTLLIQTCTGSLNEWRTEYSFAFNKVVQ